MLFYRAALPLSSQTLSFTAGVIRRHRKSIGSCWRKLTPGQQALLVLVYLRKGETFAEVAVGFGVGAAKAWRYVKVYKTTRTRCACCWRHLRTHSCEATPGITGRHDRDGQALGGLGALS